MEEEQNRSESSENGERKEEQEKEEKLLRLLDSTDDYLTLCDSLSSTLRQGWFELASARHSMGTSRVSSTLFDHKLHSAATMLRVARVQDESPSTDPMLDSHDEMSSPSAKQMDGDELDRKSNSPQLRRRGTTQVSEADKEQLASNMSSLSVDDQVEKERSKSLSVFGTLVSPKLRSAQVSFETALETLVKVANMRSLLLSTYAEVKNDVNSTKE
ncbi:coiled-coil domain-containing protein 115-like [Papaver somniferum]|uniref:coiled-coil domain-containing protein 115-like n=1 Tax=Papaver somniferum TaxID=3469 RepID=UPI000E6F65A1|nr:coiled-coil domain-containing protein 115-like [Papaver somniferum]